MSTTTGWVRWLAVLWLGLLADCSGESELGGAPGTSVRSSAGREAQAGSFAPQRAGTAAAGATVMGAPSGQTAGASGAGGRGVAADPGAPARAGAGAGANGAAGSTGQAGSDANGASGETGRMAGMTAAHNRVRAMVQATPPLPPMTWSPTLARYAQEWADMLAMNSCDRPDHRNLDDLVRMRYGENLAVAGGTSPRNTTPQWAVDGWAAEVKCWTYGSLGVTERCDRMCTNELHTDGCGHYTQIVFRDTTQVGCGVSMCQAGGLTRDIWICNYTPPGNVLGVEPY